LLSRRAGDGRQRAGGVFGLADDLEVRVLPEHRRDALAGNRVVFDNQDSVHIRCRPHLRSPAS